MIGKIKKCITVNSLQGPGSIYKHSEMLFKISDLTDYRYKLFTGETSGEICCVYTAGGKVHTRLLGASEWHGKK